MKTTWYKMKRNLTWWITKWSWGVYKSNLQLDHRGFLSSRVIQCNNAIARLQTQSAIDPTLWLRWGRNSMGVWPKVPLSLFCAMQLCLLVNFHCFVQFNCGCGFIVRSAVIKYHQLQSINIAVININGKEHFDQFATA